MFPPYSQLVDPRAVGVTFVRFGSVFFTAAAASQLAATLARIRSDRLAVCAGCVQLIGTVLFNINTIDALIETLNPQQVRRLVWGPDLFGSVAFLVASHLAWLDTVRPALVHAS